jgi:2-methylcitrate dehydratase
MRSRRTRGSMRESLGLLLVGARFSSSSARTDGSSTDSLREKMKCVEDKRYSVDYMDPEKRSIGNAITLTLNDGTVLDEVEIEYPVGHKRRRAEGTPLLNDKFRRHIGPHFSSARQEA